MSQFICSALCPLTCLIWTLWFIRLFRESFANVGAIWSWSLFNVLNFTSMYYRSTKWVHQSISCLLLWIDFNEWSSCMRRGWSACLLLCRISPGKHSSEVVTIKLLQCRVSPSKHMLLHGSTSSVPTCLRCSWWCLYRFVTCCTVLWVNAALLRSHPWSQFAPSRQSVLSPECSVLLGVSRATLRLLFGNSTPLGIY